jgi:excisionase family DNA binding protein
VSFPGWTPKSGNFSARARLEKFPEMPVRPGKLWTTREVAGYLHISPATVLRRWRDGSLPGYRISSNVLRFDPAEVHEWLEARRG